MASISNLISDLTDYYLGGASSEQVLINSGISPTPELEELIALSQVELSSDSDELEYDVVATATAYELVNLMN